MQLKMVCGDYTANISCEEFKGDNVFALSESISNELEKIYEKEKEPNLASVIQIIDGDNVFLFPLVVFLYNIGKASEAHYFEYLMKQQNLEARKAYKFITDKFLLANKRYLEKCLIREN